MNHEISLYLVKLIMPRESTKERGMRKIVKVLIRSESVNSTGMKKRLFETLSLLS